MDLDSAIKRLEDVTKRLEQLGGLPASSQSASSPSSAGPAGDAASTSSNSSSPMVSAYESWVSDFVNPYIDLSNQIGDDVKNISEFIIHAIAEQKLYLQMATGCTKPAQKDLVALITPQNKCIIDATSYKDSKPRTNYRDHLSSIGEFMPVFGWILQDKPAPYIQECRDSVMFWSNKVLKKYKDDAENVAHVEWTKALILMCNELQKYVRQHHTTGVSWSKSGPAATIEELKKKPGYPPKPNTGAAAAAPPAGGPPPPPAGPPAGPPPPPAGGALPTASAPKANASSALFSEINNLGSDKITSHLKSVPRDPVTGKRIKTKEGVSKDNLVVKPLKEKSPPKPATKVVKKTPKFECLGGKKWIIEHQENNNELVIDDATMRMTVYVFKCEKCTIQVHGKCNSITLDGCKKVNLVFDNAVAGVDVVNCQSVKDPEFLGNEKQCNEAFFPISRINNFSLKPSFSRCQVIGSVPNIQVDKTDGFHMYLSKESQSCQFITAKSSEMNISVVKDDDDFMEVPIPEQFKTVWCEKSGGFTTIPNDN